MLSLTIGKQLIHETDLRNVVTEQGKTFSKTNTDVSFMQTSNSDMLQCYQNTC